MPSHSSTIATSVNSSWRDSMPCSRLKASSLPVRIMPVVVHAAMSRRTLSKVLRHTSKSAHQLDEAGLVFLLRLVRGKTTVWIAIEGFADQPEESGVHVGIAIGDELGRKLPLEILFLQSVMQIFQGVKHGAKAVEIGAAVGLCPASAPARARCIARPGCWCPAAQATAETRRGR